MGRPWTAEAPLPGGDFPFDGVADLVRALSNAYPFLAEAHLQRLVRAYGTRTIEIINGARRSEDLGRRFGADLTEARSRTTWLPRSGRRTRPTFCGGARSSACM